MIKIDQFLFNTYQKEMFFTVTGIIHYFPVIKEFPLTLKATWEPYNIIDCNINYKKINNAVVFPDFNTVDDLKFHIKMSV